MQNIPSRPSEANELRSLVQSISTKNLDLDDTVIMNEIRAERDYHMVTRATNPFQRQTSNNTTVSQNEHLIAEPKYPPQDPVNQTALAFEKLANLNPQPSFCPPEKHLTPHLTGTWKTMRNSTTLKILFTEHSECNPTFMNIQRTQATTLEDILLVFRRKYVNPESSASAKDRFHRLTLDPERQKPPDFLEELQETAEKLSGDIASQKIENLLYA